MAGVAQYSCRLEAIATSTHVYSQIRSGIPSQAANMYLYLRINSIILIRPNSPFCSPRGLLSELVVSPRNNVYLCSPTTFLTAATCLHPCQHVHSPDLHPLPLPNIKRSNVKMPVPKGLARSSSARVFRASPFNSPHCASASTSFRC